jgi:hypothetical protein
MTCIQEPTQVIKSLWINVLDHSTPLELLPGEFTGEKGVRTAPGHQLVVWEFFSLFFRILLQANVSAAFPSI